MEATESEKNEMGGCFEPSRPVQVSTEGIIKVCPHRYVGCASQSGYTCLQGGQCDPVDENGRHFTVRYIVKGSQRFVVKDFGKKIVLPIIDADLLRAADTMLKNEDAIADTPFADIKPFDPCKFVTDVIGS